VRRPGVGAGLPSERGSSRRAVRIAATRDLPASSAASSGWK
jgi:hypothetical protein